MSALSPIGKAAAVTCTLKNWPLVILDKAGVVRSPLYRTRSGLTFECRGRSTDVNELVVVTSGSEYDPSFLVLSNANPVVLDLGANIGAFTCFVDLLNRDVPYSGFAFEQ